MSDVLPTKLGHSLRGVQQVVIDFDAAMAAKDAEITSLRTAAEDMESALEPFVRAYNDIGQGIEDWHYYQEKFTVGSIRRARAALTRYRALKVKT